MAPAEVSCRQNHGRGVSGWRERSVLPLPPVSSVTGRVASGAGARQSYAPCEYVKYSLWLLSSSVGADTDKKLTEKMSWRLWKHFKSSPPPHRNFFSPLPSPALRQSGSPSCGGNGWARSLGAARKHVPGWTSQQNCGFLRKETEEVSGAPISLSTDLLTETLYRTSN